MTTSPHTTHRETTIDALRGLAVIGMIVAHAIFFLHDGTSGILQGLERLANITVLTIFLFVSGVSASKLLDTYAHTPLINRLRRTIAYAGIVYLAYIITAVVGIFTSTPLNHPQEIINRIYLTATFISPPNFMEYMPLFMFLPVFTFLFQRVLRRLRTSLVYTLIVSAGLYASGVLLYPLGFGYPLTTIKELFAGGQTLLRFPILFYTPVFLFGLWWEHRMQNQNDRSIQRIHIGFMTTVIILTIGSIILSQIFSIPMLSPDTRWPPSVAFLLSGISAATICAFFLAALPVNSSTKGIYRFMAYVGRDSLDLWATHLILLFAYHALVKTQFGDSIEVLLLTSLVIIASTFISSISLTNRISFSRFGPLAFAPREAKRFRKRYIALVAVLSLLLLISLAGHPAATPYGTKLPEAALSMYDQLENVGITLTSKRLWHIRTGPKATPVQLTVRIANTVTNKPLNINPNSITITVGNTSMSLRPKKVSGATLLYEIPASAVPAGRYSVSALASTGFTRIRSNTVDVIISEPVYVAWTFDWEGWDAPDNALLSIDSFAETFGDIPFTHFVNPRTFMSEDVPQNRRDSIRQYLLQRASLGDEIALHLHMHYDLVEAAGVTPRKTRHWGLRSAEGYDVPTSEYTTDEFKKIVTYAQSLMRQQGFPPVSGFRAGGWFLTSPQLTSLAGLGFSYDSSGRDKPETGAFAAIPWRLTAGAQPYYPESDNQNVPASAGGSILEIPNNGTTTYEGTATQLQNRARVVYAGGILTSPGILVFVSHPQFAPREFRKIPEVLSVLHEQSHVKDAGAVIFSSVNTIYTVWKSF